MESSDPSVLWLRSWKASEHTRFLSILFVARHCQIQHRVRLVFRCSAHVVPFWIIWIKTKPTSAFQEQSPVPAERSCLPELSAISAQCCSSLLHKPQVVLPQLPIQRWWCFNDSWNGSCLSACKPLWHPLGQVLLLAVCLSQDFHHVLHLLLLVDVLVFIISSD